MVHYQKTTEKVQIFRKTCATNLAKKWKIADSWTQTDYFPFIFRWLQETCLKMLWKIYLMTMLLHWPEEQRFVLIEAIKQILTTFKYFFFAIHIFLRFEMNKTFHDFIIVKRRALFGVEFWHFPLQLFTDVDKKIILYWFSVFTARPCWHDLILRMASWPRAFLFLAWKLG